MNVIVTNLCPVAALAGVATLMHACSGPQPLDMAIQPGDEEIYLGAMSVDSQSPREAFLQAKAKATGKSVEQVRLEDDALSATKNHSTRSMTPMRSAAAQSSTSTTA